ncbi:hypothetical protein Tco_0169879 [Tanacetum coccineum]
MHIRNDPSFFLTNRTGAPLGDELGARATGCSTSCSLKWHGDPTLKQMMALYLPLDGSLQSLARVAKLLAVSAFWYTRTVMVEVTLGDIEVLAPLYGFPVQQFRQHSPAVFAFLFGCWVWLLRGASSYFSGFSVLSLSKVLISISINSSCHLNSLLAGLWLRCHNT